MILKEVKRLLKTPRFKDLNELLINMRGKNKEEQERLHKEYVKAQNDKIAIKKQSKT